MIHKTIRQAIRLASWHLSDLRDAAPNVYRFEMKRFRTVLAKAAQSAYDRGDDDLANFARWIEENWYKKGYMDSGFADYSAHASIQKLAGPIFDNFIEVIEQCSGTQPLRLEHKPKLGFSSISLL